jgi:hypothetical protein
MFAIPTIPFCDFAERSFFAGGIAAETAAG